MCGVGKMVKVWGNQDTDQCPRCEEHKMVAHILACKAPSTIQQFQDSVEKLDEWMKESLTATDIWEVLKQALLSWKKRVMYIPQTDLREVMEAAIAEQ